MKVGRKKGTKHSEETKKKISESNKGKHSYWIGKKMSEESNKKRSVSLMGIKKGPMSRDHKKKVSEGRRGIMVGKDHPLWKGGIPKVNKSIRTSARYKEWRMKVFVRDNFRCILCGVAGYIEAHHKKQLSELIKENQIKDIRQAESCDELWDVKNGVTLCEECHGEVDDYKKRFLRGEED